jgi:gliding motility-associated lipoprotein GldH
MRRSKATYLLCLALLCALCGCDNQQTIADRYQALPADGWGTEDTLSFPIDSIASPGDYRLKLCMRTTREIPFQSVFVVVEQQYEKPRLQLRDTIEMRLADDQGNLEGRGLYLYTTEADAPHRLQLHQGQRGTIRVAHIMRRHLLPGIRDVGITITR